MQKVLFVALFLFLPVMASASSQTVVIPVFSDNGYSGTPYPGSWTEVHDSTYGRYDNSTDEYFDVYSAALQTDAGYLTLYRSFLSFDTSAIPDNAQITAAALVVTPYVVLNEVPDAYATIEVLPSFQADPQNASLDDFELCGSAVTSPENFSEKVSIGSFIPNTQIKIPLISTGTTFINKQGFTPLCMREGHDSSNIEVVNNSDSWMETGAVFYSSEYFLPERRPSLEITYTVSDEMSRDVFLSLVRDAVQGENKPTRRLITAAANEIFDLIDVGRNRLALVALRVFEVLLRAKGVENSELDTAIAQLREQLR